MTETQWFIYTNLGQRYHILKNVHGRCVVGTLKYAATKVIFGDDT